MCKRGLSVVVPEKMLEKLKKGHGYYESANSA